MELEATPVRGNIRSPLYRRISHGVFTPIVEGLTAWEEWLRDLAGWQLLLPDSAMFTGLTGARLAGWDLPRVALEWVPIFVAVGAPDPAIRRPGLVVSQFRRSPGYQAWHYGDFPLDQPEEVLLRCARDLDLVDMVILVESALRKGHVTPARLAHIAASRRPGVRLLRQAVAHADPRSESPMETVLRLFLWCADVPVEVQWPLVDADGREVGRADLRVRDSSLLIEYDGEVHRDASTQQSDLRRERLLADLRLQRRAYTRPELVQHPAVVMAELDRILGRPTRPRRLARWRRAVAHSTYTPSGRDRLRTRWATRMGVFTLC